MFNMSSIMIFLHGFSSGGARRVTNEVTTTDPPEKGQHVKVWIMKCTLTEGGGGGGAMRDSFSSALVGATGATHGAIFHNLYTYLME